MKDLKDISRSLLTFAFVAENFQRTNDIYSGLIPLFAPVLNNRKGMRYTPEQLSADIEKTYGLDMHPYVAEQLAPKFVEAGLLEQKGSKEATWFLIKGSAQEEFQFKEENLQEIFTHYIDYCAEHAARVGIELPENELVNGFLSRLRNPHFFNILTKPDKSFASKYTVSLTRGGGLIPSTIDARIDVLIASYLLHLYEKDNAKFLLVAQIASGAAFSEVVLSLGTPDTSEEGYSGTVAFVDSPIIMDYLDLNDDKHRVYSQKLMEQLRSLGIKTLVFEHELEELHDAIDTPLSAYLRGQDAFGPLVRRIEKDRSHAAYARAVVTDLRKWIEDAGFEIQEISHPKQIGLNKILSTEDEDRLGNNIGDEGNILRRRRDAKSVAQTFRFRGEKAARNNVLRSRYFFVTRNDRLARMANGYMRYTGVLGKQEAPITITDRQLAGVLWITVGGVAKELSSMQLLANCVAAIAPRKDVITRMYSFLEKLSEEKAKLFDAIMRDDRAAFALMEETLGDASLVTEENYQDIFDELLQRLTEAEREKAIKEAATLRREFEGQLEAERAARAEDVRKAEAARAEEAKFAENRIEALQSAVQTREERNTQLSEELEILRSEKRGRKNRIIFALMLVIRAILILFTAGLFAAVLMLEHTVSWPITYNVPVLIILCIFFVFYRKLKIEERVFNMDRFIERQIRKFFDDN